MYPHDRWIANHLRHRELLEEGAKARLLSGAALLPAPSWRMRVASTRRTIGYRLVEAGLHLAVGADAPRLRPELSSRPPP